jgi:predicted nucleic acid-binding protein
VIVVDASAVIEVLLNTPAGVRVADRLFADGETLHAPHLLDLEVAQVLRRYALSAELDSARGAQALEDLAALPLSRYPHTAYDAAYVAPAEVLAAPLVTRDAALAASRGHAARIELL